MLTKIVGSLDTARKDVERLIRDVYFNHYGAWIPTFPTRMAAAFGRDDRPVCAAGLRDAHSGFFSETYLDQPVEQSISAAVGMSVDRRKVVEVTTLASLQPGASLMLLDFMMQDSLARNMQWGLFTATRSLRQLLRRVGAEVIELAPANPARIGNALMWGSYYETDPVVCVIAGQPASVMPRQKPRLISQGPQLADV